MDPSTPVEVKDIQNEYIKDKKTRTITFNNTLETFMDDVDVLNMESTIKILIDQHEQNEAQFQNDMQSAVDGVYAVNLFAQDIQCDNKWMGAAGGDSLPKPWDEMRPVHFVDKTVRFSDPLEIRGARGSDLETSGVVSLEQVREVGPAAVAAETHNTFTLTRNNWFWPMLLMAIIVKDIRH